MTRDLARAGNHSWPPTDVCYGLNSDWLSRLTRGAVPLACRWWIWLPSSFPEAGFFRFFSSSAAELVDSGHIFLHCILNGRTDPQTFFFLFFTCKMQFRMCLTTFGLHFDLVLTYLCLWGRDLVSACYLTINLSFSELIVVGRTLRVFSHISSSEWFKFIWIKYLKW